MFAIIATGGKQYKVSQGDVIYVEKLDNEIDSTVSFDVLMVSGDNGVTVGNPVVSAAKVEGKVLGSKRVNAEMYSTNMQKAGSTVAIDANYDIIEAYVVGKTVADLEAELAGKTAEEMVDAVAGCTLVDTLGYLNGILEAAKNVK